MKKTIIATSIAAALLGVTPSANAAFTALSAGSYTMEINSGCFGFDNCQANGTGAFTDNTAGEVSTISTAAMPDASGRAVGSTVGSGTVGGTNGTIKFTVDAAGNMSVTSYAQDSYLNTAGGTFYLDATNTSAMTGNIDGSGNVTFTPTGRYGMAAGYATSLGIAEWNRDNTTNGLGTGLYRDFTTGTSTNRSKGANLAFSVFGSALVDDGMGGWTGSLASAGNIGQGWGPFNNQQYSELFNVSITADVTTPQVPVPAAVWLFGSGLLGLVGVARRRKNS